ncbi:MAG: SDR family oxidoreductase [Candidatus Aenigmatarchaeota archaeon]
MEKILITGSTGLLGYWISKIFIESNFNVYLVYNTHEPKFKDAEKIALDITNFEKVKETLKKVKPDVIIHSAALTDVDLCEKEKELAYNVNVNGTRNFIKSLYTLNLSSKFIYISTDYVFDGQKGNYREYDIPNPINYYGLTKLLGEEVTKTYNNYIIIRTSALFGFSPSGKENFGLIALKKLINNEKVKAFVDQIVSPTYVEFLADAIFKLIKLEISNDILHIAGEAMSRYDFALKLAKILNKENLIEKSFLNEANFIAKRPKNSSLNVEKQKNYKLYTYTIEECIEKFIKTYYAYQKS